MVKNYLKSAKDITAPLNWKSAPDSPETQLAYVTQPEIDMLVEANLHDSMDGKPNIGPNGIMSLDGDIAGTTTKKSRKKAKQQAKTSKKSKYKPSAWAKKKIAENKAKKTTTKKDTKKDTLFTKAKNVIMGGTPTGDEDAATKKTWEDAEMGKDSTS